MSGHSFLPCDRDFGVIEKRKKRRKSFIPEDLQTNPPFFQVIPMAQSNFFDIGKAADTIINTKSLRIESDDPGVIYRTISDV